MMSKNRRIKIDPIEIKELAPKYKRPQLTEEEKKHNAQVNAQLYKIRMKQLGFKLTRFWLPEAIKKDVQETIKQKIRDWKEENGIK